MTRARLEESVAARAAGLADYTIVFPIPAYSPTPGRLLVSSGLARDLVSQLGFEPRLRIITPRARQATDVKDAVEMSVEEFPGFSFCLLPWSGNLRTFWLALLPIRRILAEEAKRSGVWHDCCSTARWDLTTESFRAGHMYATSLRVLGLDSDPAAMLEKSGLANEADTVRRRYEAWAAEVDLTIMMGQGVYDRYAGFARRAVLTHSVWLARGDLADPAQVANKFAHLAPMRLFLPSRFASWKGIDDTILAIRSIAHELPPFTLDIMGDGPDRERLMRLAAPEPRIRFLDPLPYGPTFFRALQSYHLVIAPTRAQEETRIVYDAAASGCVLLSSATATLEAALAPLERRWSFVSSDVADLARSLRAAIMRCDTWAEAGQEALRWMRGRTIDEMHAVRARAIAEARDERGKTGTARSGQA